MSTADRTRKYSLAYLTSAPLSPLGAIALAARTGFDHVGIRIMPASVDGEFSPLIQDKALLKATQASLSDHGISVFDVEIVRLNEHFDIRNFSGFLETCSALKARAVLVAGDDPDETRLTDNFAAFCVAAKPHGVTADLEFMPWTAVKSASQALRIVQNAGQENGGILVDAVHFGRSRTSLDDLRAIPPSMLHYTQLCDATAGTGFSVPEMIQTARHERLYPGQGTVDIAGMLSSLPADLPISIEIPNDVLKSTLGLEKFVVETMKHSRTFK
jgi:sugar phosphate isomerase/epimerase